MKNSIKSDRVIFESVFRAAIDFARNYNPISIEMNREYASYIYEIRNYRCVYKRIPAAYFPFWFRVFAKNGVINVPFRTYTSKYSYVKPLRGTKKSAYFPVNWFFHHRVVGLLHTHAAYDPKYGSGNDRFSKRDRRFSNRKCLPSYVVTPLGILRKYNPMDKTDIVVHSSVPHDPEHPVKKSD